MVGILEITKLPAEDPRINETVLSMEPPRRVDLQITDGDTVRTNVPLLSSDVYVSNGYLIRDCTIRAFSTVFSGPNDGSQEALTASIERADDGNPLVIPEVICGLSCEKARIVSRAEKSYSRCIAMTELQP